MYARNSVTIGFSPTSAVKLSPNGSQRPLATECQMINSHQGFVTPLQNIPRDSTRLAGVGVKLPAIDAASWIAKSKIATIQKR